MSFITYRSNKLHINIIKNKIFTIESVESALNEAVFLKAICRVNEKRRSAVKFGPIVNE